MLLHLVTDRHDDHVLITASGEIDASNSASVATAVRESLESGASPVILDIGLVTFMDSTGLGVLVTSHRFAGARQSHFAVVRLSAQTRRLVRLLGLDGVLHIYDTPEQALANLQ